MKPFILILGLVPSIALAAGTSNEVPPYPGVPTPSQRAKMVEPPPPPAAVEKYDGMWVGATPVPLKLSKVPISGKIGTWRVIPDDMTIRAALDRWCKDAGWQLSWEVPVDYPSNLTATFEGAFEEAVQRMADTLENAPESPQFIFYAGNKVLRVVSTGVKK